MDVPAVVFQLAFARAAPGARAAATAAALAAQRLAQPLQPGQPVAQQGQLGLQLAFPGHGPAAEDLQDQHGPVQHLDAQGIAQVADLAAGELPVKHGSLGLQIHGVKPGLLQLAGAQHGAGFRGIPLLDDLCRHLHPVGLGQGGQLFQAPFHIILSQVQRQQKDPGKGLLVFG